MSEVRLYCDLLIQQVQTIQTQHTANTETSPTSEVPARFLFFFFTTEGCSVQFLAGPAASCHMRLMRRNSKGLLSGQNVGHRVGSSQHLTTLSVTLPLCPGLSP